MGNGLLLLFIIGFLILSAFFSGSETAFFSLTKVQLKKLEKEKSAASKRVFRLLKRPRELLILILLGNTIVNVAASSAAALITINLFPESTELPLFVEIIVMTMILLIFGEITPKLVAYSSPQKFISFSSVILQILRYVLFPVIKILDFISSLFSTNKNISAKTNLSTEDIKHIINSSATEKSLEENEKQIIASIFRFSTTMAKEIMIPRVDIVAVEASDGLKNLKEIIFKSGHSRIPVYKKNIDNIIGIVYAKDIILNPEKKTISALLRPPLF
ncbi:MAG: HlyC/CorC family transporter, partial [Candidatus Cloacimonadota bacterium]